MNHISICRYLYACVPGIRTKPTPELFVEFCCPVAISRTDLRTILWSLWQMECLDWQNTITWEGHHQVLTFGLHTDFWRWLEVWIPIGYPFPLVTPPPNSSTRCSWGLGCTSQISDLTSCVKHQIALGHLNSESAEVKSWLSCIPSGPSPASSAECSSSLHIHRNKRQLAGIGYVQT